MGTLDGKVAFISGGARGQGRSHAVKLAEEGADIIMFDLCEQIDTVPYPMATSSDLDETVKLVEALDRRIHAEMADVRDPAAVQAVLDAGLAEFGHVDIVLANAGIMPVVGEKSALRAAWHDAIDVMLTGVLTTVEAALPAMVGRNQGGSIVITSSTAGIKGPTRSMRVLNDGMLGYVAAKHGVVGLMRAYANAVGPLGIRVNTIHPTGVNTGMVANPAFMGAAQDAPELLEAMTNILPTPLIEAQDISNAIAFLVSDAGRFITGTTFMVDAGTTIR